MKPASIPIAVFQQMVAGLADQGVLVLDARGTIISWNAGAERLAQFTATDVIDQPVSRFLIAAIDEFSPSGLASLTDSQQHTFQPQLRRRDDTSIPANIQIVPLSEAGVRVGFLLTISEATGQSPPGVIHEFNNQLMVISCYGDILMSQFTPGTPQYDAIAAIREAAAQASALTRELRARLRRQ